MKKKKKLLPNSNYAFMDVSLSALFLPLFKPLGIGMNEAGMIHALCSLVGKWADGVYF